MVPRASLREGAKVLLDPLDHEDFMDILAGKEVTPSVKLSKGNWDMPGGKKEERAKVERPGGSHILGAKGEARG